MYPTFGRSIDAFAQPKKAVLADKVATSRECGGQQRFLQLKGVHFAILALHYRACFKIDRANAMFPQAICYFND